ncbi:plasma protease C1 inhibitor [Centroberyx affinis]|uniref:plasma protease C1 inhibitor n=1 Tax=Centroberyx affinis TaxID=166261 RepID=UPI003A5BB6EE
MRHLVLFCLLLQLIFELSSSSNLRVVPGSSLTLPCLPMQGPDFTGAVVTWTFDGKNISSQAAGSAGSLAVSKNGFYLSISSVIAPNAGEYVCVMEHNDVKWSRTYTIEVDALSGYTLKIRMGSETRLPCYRPPSSPANNYALWFKETEGGKRTQLTPVEIANDDQRLEWHYPNQFDSDQTIILTKAVMEDAGIYHCESDEGERFNSIHLIVEADAPFSCSAYSTLWEPCQDETSRSWAPMLEESQAEFSMKLYSHLSQWQPSKNLLFSPISISGVLSHLLLGARDTTRRDIEVALCVPHDFHCVHLQMKRLKEKLAGSLQTASQIYYNQNMTVNESFTSQSMQFYEAEPVRLLASSAENTQMINSWVANKTNNKITQLVDSVPGHTQLILLNAVSFSGQWKVKFDGKDEKALFTKLNGDLVKVPVLYSYKYLVPMEYVPEVKAQVARFPLTGGSSLYILLPHTHKPSDLQQVEERMTDTAVRQMIERMKVASPQHIEVTLPKIKLDVQADMNLLLRKLGLSSLFEGANLCGLYSDSKMFLTDARHRAFLALTKDGVEAGAATSLSFSRSFPSFSALRPFILLLWSEQANVPLFMGRVTEP